MFPEPFLDHVQRPRGQGALGDATHRGHAEDTACGDRLWLDLRVVDGVVRDVRYRVQGCAGVIAVGSVATVLLPGRPARADALPAEDVDRALGGIPRAKRHALRLIAAVLAAAFPPA